MRKIFVLVLVVISMAGAGVLCGCSSKRSGGPNAAASATPTPTSKPTETKTGRIAFQNMYIQAHAWAPDAQGFVEQSQPTKEITGIDGKSAVWSALFGSRARGIAKACARSGTDSLDAPPRGISPSSEDSFSPNNLSTQIFDVGFLRSDTDQAFKVAQDHGGKALLEKEPTLPVRYRLEGSSRDNTAVWHVIYGKYKLSVAVDATTGQYLHLDR